MPHADEKKTFIHCMNRLNFKSHLLTIDPTLSETNVAPENGWLKDDISFWDSPYFQGQTVSFREGMPTWIMLPLNFVAYFRWFYDVLRQLGSFPPHLNHLFELFVCETSQKKRFETIMFLEGFLWFLSHGLMTSGEPPGLFLLEALHLL